jgi:hypothetical protein
LNNRAQAFIQEEARSFYLSRDDAVSSLFLRLKLFEDLLQLLVDLPLYFLYPIIPLARPGVLCIMRIKLQEYLLLNMDSCENVTFLPLYGTVAVIYLSEIYSASYFSMQLYSF